MKYSNEIGIDLPPEEVIEKFDGINEANGVWNAQEQYENRQKCLGIQQLQGS